MEVPCDRNGTLSTELFGRYQRSEKALVLSLMQMVVQGVGTRRVKKIPERLCRQRFSKSTVSDLAKRIDEQVEAWVERSLEECPFLICDALHLGDDTSPWVRRQGAVRSTTVLLAVGVADEGQREILGLEVAFGETQAAWERLLGRLKKRGLEGVEVATSDAHDGLRQAVEENFPGESACGLRASRGCVGGQGRRRPRRALRRMGAGHRCAGLTGQVPSSTHIEHD
jgi:transposase-like protein